LQVLEVFDLEVNAESEAEAIETAMQSQSSEIHASGKLVDVTTDFPEIVQSYHIPEHSGNGKEN